jgi:hypothetical protein
VMTGQQAKKCVKNEPEIVASILED